MKTLTEQIAALTVKLDDAHAKKTAADEQIKAEEKKNVDTTALLTSFKEKLKTEREKGAESLTGLSQKLQLELDTASTAHTLEVTEKSKTIENLQKELVGTKARLSDVLAEKEKHCERGDASGRQVTELTEKLSKADAKETARATEVSKLGVEVKTLTEKVAAASASTVASTKMHEDKVTALNQSIETLRSDLAQSSSRSQKLDATVAEKENEIKKLLTKQEALNTAEKALSADKTKLVSKVQDLEQQLAKHKEESNLKYASSQADFARISAALLAEQAARSADLKASSVKVETLSKGAEETRVSTAKAVDVLTVKVQALQTVTVESEKKQAKLKTELAEKVTEVVKLQETVQEIKSKHVAEVAILRKETTDKFSIMRDEINLIAIEKKVLGDTLAKKIEETTKELTVLKKESAAQAKENSSKFMGPLYLQVVSTVM